MIKLSSLLLFFLIAIQVCFSQSTDKTVNQSIEWFSINSTVKVHEKVGIYVEGNFRFAQDLDPQQHQFRTALEINLSKKLFIVPIGYVYTWNFLYGKQPASYINNEHRLFQQIVYKHSFNRFFFQHRARMEERFIQDHHRSDEGIIVGDEYNDERYRVRYRALAYIPLKHTKIEAKTWFISVWDEVFISWGKKVTYHSPDQNRLFVGMGYQFTKLLSVQAGPLYQMIKKSNGVLQENNYGGLVQLTYNIDLTKPSK